MADFTGRGPREAARPPDCARPPAKKGKHFPRWTREQETLLRDNLGALGAAGVSELVGKSVKAVEGKARTMGCGRTQEERRADELARRRLSVWPEGAADRALGHERLAYSLARRHHALSCQKVPLDELESMALYALKDASRLFRPEKCVVDSFVPFASRSINNMLIRLRRDWCRRQKIWSKPLSSVLVGAAGEGESEWEPADPKGRDPADEADVRVGMGDVLGVLPERLREVIGLRSQGFSQDEVATRLGLGRSYVSELELRAIAFAKERLCKRRA